MILCNIASRQYTYIYIYIYMYYNRETHVRQYSHLSVSLSLSLYISLYVHIYRHKHTYIYICIYTYIYILMFNIPFLLSIYIARDVSRMLFLKHVSVLCMASNKLIMFVVFIGNDVFGNKRAEFAKAKQWLETMLCSRQYK